MLLFSFSAHAEEPLADLILIAHPQFPIQEISLESLDRLYLGRVKGLGDIEEVHRVHAPIASAGYQSFTQKVHQMTVPDLRRYWAKEVIMGRRSPPRQFDSFEALIKFVAETPNAIGYLPAEMTPVGVKVLMVEGKAKF